MKPIIILFFTMVFILLAIILPPVSQPDSFHHFADSRSWLGVTNAGNVLSNFAFLIVAAYGIFLCIQAKTPGNVNAPYLAMFIGLFLTSIGSAYYHWQPDSNRLIWDRLPMTIVFMPLLIAVFAERLLCFRVTIFLPAALVTGIFTVIYWKYSGNLIPYFVAQYGSIFLLLLTILLFPMKGDRFLYLACLAYGGAMLSERFDLQIFQATSNIVSGHTIKHIVAAVAFCSIAYKLKYYSNLK